MSNKFVIGTFVIPFFSIDNIVIGMSFFIIK